MTAKILTPIGSIYEKQISKTWDLLYICLFTNQGPSGGIYIKKSNIIMIVAKIMDGWNTWNELIRYIKYFIGTMKCMYRKWVRSFTACSYTITA